MKGLSGHASVAALATLLAVACAQKAPAPEAASTGPSTNASELLVTEILDEVALTRAAIQARRQVIVTSAMDLTAPEAQAFWPVYRDYRSAMTRVDDRLVELIMLYAANYDSLSDELAKKLLVDYMDVERGRLDVKSQYVPRFESVLPARKVTRFFQVDNKLDKKLQAELAAEIPLTR
jgi:hypothetical protein